MILSRPPASLGRSNATRRLLPYARPISSVNLKLFRRKLQVYLAQERNASLSIPMIPFQIHFEPILRVTSVRPPPALLPANVARRYSHQKHSSPSQHIV